MSWFRTAPIVCALVIAGCSSSTSSNKPGGTPSGKNDPGKAGLAESGKTAQFRDADKTAPKSAKRPATPDAPWLAEIIMENKTDATLELFVDGLSSGSAAAGLTVTTTVVPGLRTLVAKTLDGRSISKTVTLLGGDVLTWTISLQ